MRFLTSEEGSAWLRQHDLPEPGGPLADRGFFHEAAYRVPGDAGRKTALARLLVASVDVVDQEGMLWISGYGIWPSSENQALFYMLRKALGESRVLAEVPCHVFGSASLSDLECLVDVVLYFSWDATLFSPTQSLVIRLSHDEVVEVCGRDSAQFLHADFALREFRLNPV